MNFKRRLADIQETDFIDISKRQGIIFKFQSNYWSVTPKFRRASIIWQFDQNRADK